ncbi:MAG: hypothetical protein NTX75_09670 [Proteobacteria bacterium]|nr:hypothetical protein [Pseudomonadota bacterium]
MSGYGPETITVNQFTIGNTRYAVYNYTGSPSITASSAVVVVKDANGNVITTYTVPTTGTGDWWKVFLVQASSGSSGTLYTLNSINSISDSSLPTWHSSGSITGTLQGSGQLWTQGTAVPVTVTGTGYGGGNGSNHGSIVNTIIYSQNNSNSNKTTNDGGAYYGVLSASELNNNIISKTALLYINPSGNSAGYIKGTLTGTANTGDDTFGLSGNIYSANIASDVGVLPADLYSSINTYSYPGSSISGDGSFTAGGTITDTKIRDSMYRRQISTQNWGIWNTEAGFMYQGTTGNDWRATINMDNTNNSTYRIDRLEIAGTQWSDKRLEGSVSGYGAGQTPNGDGRTWLYFGDIVGTFDPVSLTAQSVLAGMMMDTNKFLELAATDAGKASLQVLNVPCVQVGEAHLSGSGNNLTVNINNVKFFSTTAGSAPRVWATGNVNGAYTGIPSTSSSVNISGNGLSALFNVSRWDTSAKVWVSNVANGTGNLSGGSYSGAVTFKGAGSGPIVPTTSTSGSFSGSAAGTTK